MEYAAPAPDQWTALGQRSGWAWALTDLGWTIAGPILVYLFFLAISVAIAPFIGYASPLLCLALLAALAILMRTVRRRRALLAIIYLEQAVRLNLPLPEMLRAAESAEHGKMQQILYRLRMLLESGAPVGAALARAVPAIPGRAVKLITSAEHVGQLPQTLRRLVRQAPAAGPRNPAQAIMLRWYPILVLSCLGLTGFMFMHVVLPKLIQIFHDFHLQLPAVTRWVVAIWQSIEWPLLLLAAFAAAVFCGRMLADILPVPRPLLSPWRGIVDRVAWITPVWHRVSQSRALADLCHVMSDALGACQPMDRALLEASQAVTNRVIEKRAQRWSKLVISGTPLVDAARRARMPDLLVGMLQTAHGPEGAENVFAFLARYYDGRYSAAAAVLEGAAIPVMVLVLALFVGSLAVGVFAPLAELARHMGQPRGLL